MINFKMEVILSQHTYTGPFITLTQFSIKIPTVFQNWLKEQKNRKCTNLPKTTKNKKQASLPKTTTPTLSGSKLRAMPFRPELNSTISSACKSNQSNLLNLFFSSIKDQYPRTVYLLQWGSETSSVLKWSKTGIWLHKFLPLLLIE